MSDKKANPIWNVASVNLLDRYMESDDYIADLEKEIESLAKAGKYEKPGPCKSDLCSVLFCLVDFCGVETCRLEFCRVDGMP